jgi:endonuclease IV
MNFGLKLWSTNKDTLPQAEQLINENLFHYIELTPIPGTEVETFLSYNLPYTIHITTERHGVNIAQKKNLNYNLEVINNCIEWADQLNACYLILHPGFGLLSDALESLELVHDKRILIENMPKVGLSSEIMIGYSPDQTSELMGSKFGFCFDLNHAIKASISLNKDYKKYVKDFMKFKPYYFHIADGNLNNEKDEHIAIGEGDYDFEFLGNCTRTYSSESYITLETPRRYLNSFEEDINNLNKLKCFI